MGQGIFEVQVYDNDGKDRWITVQAANMDNAKDQVAALGKVVGDARLKGVEGGATGGLKALEMKLKNDADAANTWSWLGLIFWPSAIVGWAKAHRVVVEARRHFPEKNIGETARATGMVITIVGVIILGVILFTREM